jgi:outer membrane protein OmpA-like peptidoglycan-associated protein
VQFEWIRDTVEPVTFRRNRSDVTPEIGSALDAAGRALARCPTLRCEVDAGAEPNEREGVAAERAKAVADYLQATWKLAPDRVVAHESGGGTRGARVRLTLPDGAPGPHP